MNVFKTEEVVSQKSVVEIVKDSMEIDSSGTVKFRSRVGRGSGKAVEIPADQFDAFVDLILKTQEARKAATVSVTTETLTEVTPESSNS